MIDTPISETAIVGAACGMSYLGLRPVAEMQFIDFIACCFNQVTNIVAKSHYLWGAPVPMVIRGPSGGGVHGGPFHSANPEMYFVHTPGLKVVYPSTAYDAKGLLKSAIRDNNPVLFFEHKFLYRRIKEEIPAGDYTVPIGKAVVRREGRDLTIVSYAAMVHTFAGSGRAAGEGRHRSRSDRPADAAAAGPRGDSDFREENQQAAGGARRHTHGRDRGRNCGDRVREMPSRIWTGPSCASPPSIRRCRTRRRSRNDFSPTLKKLSLPRANWQNTNAEESRSLAPWEKRKV